MLLLSGPPLLPSGDGLYLHKMALSEMDSDLCGLVCSTVTLKLHIPETMLIAMGDFKLLHGTLGVISFKAPTRCFLSVARH